MSLSVSTKQPLDGILLASSSVDSRPQRLWFAATAWLVVLGPLFFVVYGWCNAVSARREHVGSFFFGWERHIPFVPWMIVPYLSIDLFFAVSFFLCRDRAQLRTHAARIGLAIAVSAAVFLLFPLRYGWPRPAVGGFLGILFAPLNAMDLPYNLCPSLHISLRTILWRVYDGRLRRHLGWRLACGGWFFLIGVSTLLVYQHHVIDLLGGYVVGLFCCWCLPEADRAASSHRGAIHPLPLLPCTPIPRLPPSPPA